MSNKMEQIIERQTRDFKSKAESLYNKGYTAGKNDGYALGKESGMEEAWELIKKALTMPMRDFSLAFGLAECLEDITYMSIQEISKAMSEYEESKAKADTFCVGDEVIDENGLRAVVTNADTHYHLFYRHNGKTRKASKDANLKKSGRHFDVILREGVWWDDDDCPL